MNLVELIDRYLTELLNLRLRNWMSAPTAGKTTPTRVTLVHHQNDRINVTKDSTSRLIESEIHAAVIYRTGVD